MAKSYQEYCGDCKKANHSFNQVKALYRYAGPMKRAMYRFKYSNRRCFARIFARQAHLDYGRFIKDMGIELIVPVPMYEKKRRIRGYNQADVFAQALSRELEIPWDKTIIRRVQDTTPMKQLNNVQRRENLQNAFKLSASGVKFKKVLIVDDIYTTGTTLDQVAKILKTGGVEQAYGLCVCIGDND